MSEDFFGRAGRYRQPYEEVLSSATGVVIAGFSNYITHRPIISRLYLFPIYGALGFVFGRVLSDFNSKRTADRELAIWDYVRRHPEDFPELKPRKYKEVLEPWVPIR